MSADLIVVDRETLLVLAVFDVEVIALPNP